MSRRGGRSSWRRRLERIGEASPYGGLVAYLVEVMVELRDPALPADATVRLRSAIYGASVLLRAMETVELAQTVEELNRRLDGFEGSDGRLLRWPMGGEYGS